MFIDAMDVTDLTKSTSKLSKFRCGIIILQLHIETERFNDIYIPYVRKIKEIIIVSIKA